MASSANTVHIVGGGLAGSEAAWQLASAGVPVVLHEMRPVRGTEAHLTDNLAELVCSNSFRSDDAQNNAVGLLHEEMRRAGSLIMRAADAHKLPAGGALAVDRHGFSAAVQAGPARPSAGRAASARKSPACRPPTGTASSSPPAPSPRRRWPRRSRSADRRGVARLLRRHRADRPSREHRSVDRLEAVALRQGRARPATAPTTSTARSTRTQYDAFVAALLAGDKTEFKEWEHNTPYFNGCQPIEVIAASGPQTLRFGPMKPVGLRDPRTGHRPWAVVQLRQDNALGTLWNIVGFQTKLKHGEQMRLFRTIPGLQNAEFARLGGLHRNTFLNSPRLLDGTLRLKAMPRLRFAGQITGCEGYVESAAVGLLAGRFAAAERRGATPIAPPPTTAMGALLGHITGGADAATFQPMNVNFGLFPPIDGTFRGKERKQALSARALRDFDHWLAPTPLAAE